MSLFQEAREVIRRGGPGTQGPAILFTASVVAAFGALALATAALPKDFALATVGTLFFACAAIVALVAWRVGRQPERTLTYWDVAGALTLCGICAGTLLDSDQLVRLMETQRTD